jgi:hypothetical protein
MNRRTSTLRDDDADAGQISVLILGYTLIVVLVIFTAVSASAVHLARHRLMSVADGAALDAADALDQQRFYALGGAGPTTDQVVALTADSVRSSVTAYLAAGGSPGPSSPPIQVGDPTGSPDGFTAEVTLVEVVEVPWLSALGGHQGITVQVTARARARQVG